MTKNIFKTRKIILFILVVAFTNFTSGTFLGIYDVPDAEAATYKRVFITSSNAGVTWIVPANWNNARNVIEVIGGGGGGSDSSASTAANGGGGGGYAASINIKLTPGNTLTAGTDFAVGASGSGGQNTAALGRGGNTWFMVAGSFSGCTDTALCAKAEGGEGGGPADTATTALGGAVASATGVLEFAGGNGGTGHTSTTGDAATGGGGAAGPFGGGRSGGTTTGAGGPGGGGAGGQSSTAGNNATSSDVAGGNGPEGNGAGAASTAGTTGGGGGGGAPGGAGGAGREWDVEHGAGGGGGGAGDNDGAGGTGGQYGGGAGGGSACSATACRGGRGLIAITYWPFGHVIRGGVKIRGSVKFR